jgi:hypothetical protein
LWNKLTQKSAICGEKDGHFIAPIHQNATTNNNIDATKKPVWFYPLWPFKLMFVARDPTVIRRTLIEVGAPVGLTKIGLISIFD